MLETPIGTITTVGLSRFRTDVCRLLPAFRRWWSAVWLLGIVLNGASPQAHAQWAFEVRFSEQVRQEPFTGRVYLFFSRGESEPRFGPRWFGTEPFIARDVKNLRPGEAVEFRADEPAGILAYPKPLAELDLKGFRVQAVMRFNPWERQVGTGAGNGYSRVVSVEAVCSDGSPQRLLVDHLVTPRVFRETRFSRLLEVRSGRLSEFHGRQVFLRAAVILPASYFDEPDRRYPVMLQIPGFGGTHFRGEGVGPIRESNEGGVEFIRVLLDASCPLGHHVFADSANNGPVGTAFVKEFLPALDRRFRTVPAAEARFLTGHSSGGWSSLWLQVRWPETFGGTWSTAPDPVDFRDFQRINIYRPGENMYVDGEGRPRPIARRGDRPVLWYRDFAHMEEVYGPGGQLHSFEAVFSPRGDDGRPRLLWDRRTGAIDPAVAQAWRKYDIRLVLESRWKELGPKLRGKLHVFMGEKDTFYLEGATVLLKEALERLDSDAVVEIHPGKDHGTLLTAELRERIRREMTRRYLRSFPQPPAGRDSGKLRANAVQ